MKRDFVINRKHEKKKHTPYIIIVSLSHSLKLNTIPKNH